LEALAVELGKEIETREKEVERLRGAFVATLVGFLICQHCLLDIAERAESLSAAELERKKQSRTCADILAPALSHFRAVALYLSLLAHHTTLESLRKEYKKHLEREKALGEILNSLRAGYNPNYQDMAVLEAVRGWETLAGLPHINDVGKDNDGEASTAAETPTTEGNDEEEWNAASMAELERLLKTDHVSLLLEHDQLVGPASAHPSRKFEMRTSDARHSPSLKCLTSQLTFRML